jgi:Uma2 family endonuclease
MSAATAPKLMTVEEFLALPEDGVERWLIRGQLRENRSEHNGEEMTKRNRIHSRVLIRVGHLLENWLERQPEPRGQVVGGEAGFILRHDPDSTVGIDVAYVAPDVVATQTDETTLFDGPPVVAVEIESPNNTVREITEKVREYLDCGVKQVWVIGPYFQTVTIHRPNVNPVALDAGGSLDGGPKLPGFSCPVAEFFR